MVRESVFMDVVKMPLLAITVFIISFLGIYFNLPLMIPAFAASLFMIYLRPTSEFVRFKNVLGGHLIAFACAFLEPFIVPYIIFVPEIFSKAVVIGIAVLIAGWLMVVIRLEHPPAIATTLIFFNIRPEGVLIFNMIPLQSLISFLIGLLIVSSVAFLMHKKKF